MLASLLRIILLTATLKILERGLDKGPIIANIHEKYSDTKLLLIGVGESMDYIRNLVKALGVEADVIFLGLRHDVNRLMQAMDCFILPSRFEGLPVVGIEAQAADLPCFFSDSITREIAITKKT